MSNILFLLKKAEKSLRFYRNCKSTDQDDYKLQKELEKLKAIAAQRGTEETLKISDFCKYFFTFTCCVQLFINILAVTPDAWRAMLIGPSLMAISQFSGTFCVVTYAVTIFTESGSNFNPNTSSIVLGSLQIFGTYCTSLLIDRVGRKLLLGISCGKKWILDFLLEFNFLT